MNMKQFLEENIKQGEIYAGVILGKDGQPDYHLFLLPQRIGRLNFDQAVKWAESIGGELPLLRGQSLLFTNCKEEFSDDWYWSCEQSTVYQECAWAQEFNSGYQYYRNKSASYLVRAVRRVPII